ncbi:MAG TPA: hypothetical protein VM366_20245 [Anaerolineae bacterium]|nr:hypothetical protein [Anaerolineae bacterium]
MDIGQVKLGAVSASKMVLGGNPFSGFSHQSPERDDEMRRYYTTARIKDTFRAAEALGINTFLGRADRHISRVLMEYWDEGGAIQWFAQTCPEFAPHSRGIANAIQAGAVASYIHGGQMDYWVAQGETDRVRESIDAIRSGGLVAGVAGHTPRIFEWAEERLDVDFYMCCYYNPTSRDKNAEHVAGAVERFAEADRAAMAQTIQHLSKPAIHYKVFAAGRNDPAAAMGFVAEHLRPQDVVCVGVYTKDDPSMLEEDLCLLQQSLRRVGR